MCGGSPKPPKASAAQVAAEKDAALQRAMALEEQRRQKAIYKEQRFQMTLAGQGSKFGRASLLTGGKGGVGYPAPMVRSLLS